MNTTNIYYPAPTTERICVMGGDASFIAAAEQISRLVNTGLKESGINAEIRLHWCNIADMELNPDRLIGFFQVRIDTPTPENDGH